MFSEAVKSKMRFSITGYDDSLNEFRNKMGLDDNKHAPYANWFLKFYKLWYFIMI